VWTFCVNKSRHTYHSSSLFHLLFLFLLSTPRGSHYLLFSPPISVLYFSSSNLFFSLPMAYLYLYHTHLSLFFACPTLNTIVFLLPVVRLLICVTQCRLLLITHLPQCYQPSICKFIPSSSDGTSISHILW
jgi:hypothetical protein